VSFRDRIVAKLARLKAAAIAGPQKVGSKLVVRRNITEDDGELRNMRSSWVEWFEYDENTRVFTMKVKGNNTLYTWDNIDPRTALLAQRGATCKTDDPTGKRRWWPNKQNSLGAAYWYILKNHTVKASPAYATAQYTTNTTADNTMGGGYDIYAGGFEMTGKKKFREEQTGQPYYGPPKKGRPTKAQAQKAKFGWAGKYYQPTVK
jgi:hypothetical protein